MNRSTSAGRRIVAEGETRDPFAREGAGSRARGGARSRGLLSIALIALGLQACASNPSESGIRLGDDTLGQFKVGEATEDWVIAVIGPPTTRTDLPPDPNGERISILRYTTKEEAGGIASLFSGSGSKTVATVYFIVRDGLVTQMWADRAKEKTLLGQSVEKQGGEKKEEWARRTLLGCAHGLTGGQRPAR